jgi:hypothetical protein
VCECNVGYTGNQNLQYVFNVGIAYDNNKIHQKFIHHLNFTSSE